MEKREAAARLRELSKSATSKVSYTAQIADAIGVTILGEVGLEGFKSVCYELAALIEEPDDPERYDRNGMKSLDFIRKVLTKEQYEGFCRGNALKYLIRYDYKGGLDDVLKAWDYTGKLRSSLIGECLESDKDSVQSTATAADFAVLVPFDQEDGDQCALKVLEESSEFVQAARDYFDSGYTVDRVVMLDEMADLFETLHNALAYFEITPEEAAEAVERCNQRNRSRGRI